MAANDDLDDFFKKKDRKINKNKKNTGLLTNNEELLKQLVIVTSATSAFKENMDFDEEDEEDTGINNHNRIQLADESNGTIGIHDDNLAVLNKARSQTTSINNKSKNSTKLTVQDNRTNIDDQQTNNGQQDEWEEFENSNPKYDQLRLKISRGTNDQNIWNDDEDEDLYDDGHNGNNHDGNMDDNANYNKGDNDEQYSRGNRRREQQTKEKPAWKLDQIKQTEPIQVNDAVDSDANKVADLSSKPVTSNNSDVYRPPQLRNSSSITVVRGATPRAGKKEKPNLASTEEFPTLGTTVNKK